MFKSTLLLSAASASVTLGDLQSEAVQAMSAIKDIEHKSEDQVRTEFVQNLFKKKEMVDSYVQENA